MNDTIKKILKFLFPEWQIVEAVKQNGFIAWPSKKMKDNKEQEAGRYSKASRYETSPAQQTVPPMRRAATKDSHASKRMAQTLSKEAHSYEENGMAASDAISKDFEWIRAELSKDMVGQTNYLDELCLSFKRPFITGYDKGKPKNVILILGPKGTGKHSAVIRLTQLLKQKKLLKHRDVARIDLSLYASVQEFGLFVSDLYKSLYGSSDVLIFDHFEQAHPNVMEVITALSMTGRYGLDSRYIMQDQNLIDATGMLLKDSISEISANGKFFVLPSEKSEKDVIEILGRKFMNAIGDVVHTQPFSYEELQEIADRILAELQNKSEQTLSIRIKWNDTLPAAIAAQYKNATGVSGLNEYAEASIYKPLAEYRLKHEVASRETLFLSMTDDEITAQTNNSWIQLSALKPNRQPADIDNVKQELESIIGLQRVKDYVYGLEDNLNIQSRREIAGLARANISMHMIFTGNPGTGKTTIARIVARYLKALGVLSTGQLREVTRADLVGQYVGHTAKQTNDVIKSAIGGVLFIDEAYAICRDQHDSFGREAVDALVKGMEDNRNDLVVILAGYKDEMNTFLKTNSGLLSRFPHMIEFEDYTSDEMVQIALVTAKAKGYTIAEDCRGALVRLFDKKQIKGRNDSGNGRLVRNIIEAAILNQSKRLLKETAADLSLLTFGDFEFEDLSHFDLEKSLSPIIGLDQVKEFVRVQYRLLIAQDKRKKAGIEVDTSQSLNMIFSGNPGTGKTTIARVVAHMFKEMGLLKSGHLIETDQSGLVAEYVGQTAKKTEEVFRSALGGVLFIDEAYSLASEGGSFGKEAIDTLVKLIEDYRGEIIVILAGYNKEMSDFLKANSGLESRFPLRISFPDYSPEELLAIALQMITAKGFALAENSLPVLREQIMLLHKHSTIHSGNGRMVRNYLEDITRKQSARIAMNDISANEMNLIIPEDLQSENRQTSNFKLEDELSSIIGLDEVKDYIRSLSARLRMQNERKKLGLPVDSTQTLHMIFKGNPGTGKTMIARTVAQVLHQIGVMKTPKLVETDRSGLVAGYVGQTAIKTKEKVMEAMDGVLFIDEAYSLAQGGANDFGREAVDTLVKLMDDYRDRIIVILAGYSQNMDGFLSMNPGLKSRFPNIIEFIDYSTEQLVLICHQFFGSKGYELDPKAASKLQNILAVARETAQFGNGRYVRNLFEKAVNNQALRLSTDEDLTKEDLVTIIASDIEEV